MYFINLKEEYCLFSQEIEAENKHNFVLLKKYTMLLSLLLLPLSQKIRENLSNKIDVFSPNF
jgi:hypothetical protein